MIYAPACAWPNRGLREGSSSRRSAAWAAPALLGLILFTLAIRLAKPTGWLGSDDAAYYSAAEHVLTGVPIQRLHHQYARMAIILPIAASVWLFGEHPTAVWLPMLGASVACVLLIAILGRVLLGWWEGILAATVVSVLPYFRVLSTTAFPDVHACLWTTAAVLLAFAAVRRCRGAAAPSRPSETRIRELFLLVMSGLALGAAVSTKLFSAPVIAAIAYVVWIGRECSVRRRIVESTAIAFGGLVFFLCEGWFYHHAAADFFFTLHAHAQATGIEAPAAAASLRALCWQRLTMLFDTTTSGWGTLGVAFFPVMIIVLFSTRMRFLAVWGLATYLGVAFAPVGLENGIKLNPLFHGRHVLPACVPFALALAWIAGHAVLRLFAGKTDRVRTVGPAVKLLTRIAPLAAVLALAYTDRHHLNGFCDRDTRRLGQAITQIVESREWPADRPIFMAPSLYWRYRILFPSHVQALLRVAADDDAPQWWKTVCPDIAARSAPLPPPDGAFLLATPLQLAGGCEHWDYGVRLPRTGLVEWAASEPLAAAIRGGPGELALAGPPGRPDVIAVLLGARDSANMADPVQTAQGAK